MPRPPRIVVQTLRLPLAVKLAGANALLLVTAVGAFWKFYRGSAPWSELAVAALALLSGVLLNVVLVTIALRPLNDLEAAAQRVWRGDLDARAPRSPIADRDLDRVSKTFNLLLDSIMAERSRIRELAAEVIRVGDRERAALAGELHDSTAQSIAGISYQLSAAERMSQDPELTARLAAVREATNGILEEVRVLSHSVYPRILDDLGLASALRELARGLSGDDAPMIDVHVTDFAESVVKRLSREPAAVLYRVAEEAMRNALRHAHATQISVRLDGAASSVSLRVEDDGTGFDAAEVASRHAGMGLFTMRERVSLAHGRLDVSTRPGSGTTVMASIPVSIPITAAAGASRRTPTETEANDSRYDSGRARG